MRTRRGGLLFAAVILASGCAGSADTTDSTEVAAPTSVGTCAEGDASALGGEAEQGVAPLVDVAPLRQVVYDYEPFDSPEELVATGQHDVIVCGQVVAVLQGGEERGEGDGDSSSQVVLRVRVDEAFLVRRPELIFDGHVHVVLYQGARYHDGTPSVTLEEWNRAIPAGTPVMLFLFGTAEADESVGAGRNGVPAEAQGARAGVQGMVLQSGTQLVDGFDRLHGEWAQIGTLEELGRRVRAATARIE